MADDLATTLSLDYPTGWPSNYPAEPYRIITYEEEHQNHLLACLRHPARNLLHLFPAKYLQDIIDHAVEDCCKQPANHQVEAWYSCAAERDRGFPDIYIFHCTCGRQHRRFCIGGGDERPFWDIR